MRWAAGSRFITIRRIPGKSCLIPGRSGDGKVFLVLGGMGLAVFCSLAERVRFGINDDPPAVAENQLSIRIEYNKKLLQLNEILNFLVGAAGFEPATSCSQGRRANQAALRPEPVDS